MAPLWCNNQNLFKISKLSYIKAKSDISTHDSIILKSEIKKDYENITNISKEKNP